MFQLQADIIAEMGYTNIWQGLRNGNRRSIGATAGGSGKKIKDILMEFRKFNRGEKNRVAKQMAPAI